MDKEKIRQVFVDFLTDYLQASPTAQYVFQNFTSSGVEYIELEIDDFFEGVTFAFGATRGCFLLPNCDYCLKVAYDDNENDYNSKELEIFENARKRNLSQCFAGCYHLPAFEIDIFTYNYYDFETAMVKMSDNIDSESKIEKAYQWLEDHNYKKQMIHYYIPLFIYKVYDEPYESYSCNPSKDSFNVIKSSMRCSSPLAERDISLAATFIDDWGIEIFDELTNLLDDWGVKDFHTENVGIIDNRLVLIDYAGYDEY